MYLRLWTLGSRFRAISDHGVYSEFWILGSGFRDTTAVKENQVKKQLEIKWIMGLCSGSRVWCVCVSVQLQGLGQRTQLKGL